MPRHRIVTMWWAAASAVAASLTLAVVGWFSAPLSSWWTVGLVVAPTVGGMIAAGATRPRPLSPPWSRFRYRERRDAKRALRRGSLISPPELVPVAVDDTRREAWSVLMQTVVLSGLANNWVWQGGSMRWFALVLLIGTLPLLWWTKHVLRRADDAERDRLALTSHPD